MVPWGRLVGPQWRSGYKGSILMQNFIIESECKCSFGGVVWSIGRLKGVEIGTGVDVGK